MNIRQKVKSPVRKKKNQPGKKKGKPPQKSSFAGFLFLLKLFLGGIFLGVLFVITVFLGGCGKIPNRDQLLQIKTPLASEVISADGKLLGRYYTENRSHVSFSEISPHIINALVATEDARFFKHKGVDKIAILRVLFKTILQSDPGSGGGSTLSQQIAKNLFPRKHYRIFSLPVNKIREAVIAYRLEKVYTKEEIITLYLNTVPFGENVFGIEVAAERFFSKKPGDITIPEAAVLIGVLKANHLFNPRLYPERSLARRNIVIDQMVREKFITAEEGDEFKGQPLNLRYSLITYNQGPAPWFLEYIRPALTDWCLNHTKPNGEPYNLYTDGLKIYTTVDYNLQRYATNAVNEQMKALQKLFDEHWKGRDPWGKDASVLERAVMRSDRYKRGKAAGRNHKELWEEMESEIETSFFTWEGLKAVKTTPLDSVRHYLSMLSAGFVVLENYSGAIKAWVGGNDFRFFKYDQCQASRQAGSTFKPVVFLAALENGFSPLDYYSAESRTYEEYDGWTPGNASEGYSGYYTMKEALARSINTVTVDIMMQTGVRGVVTTARNLGISSPLPEVPSLALGSASLSLLEMTAAYATIANEGKPVKPYSLLSVEDSNGNQLGVFEVPDGGSTRIDPENSRILTYMLEAAVEQGTGHAIRSRFHVPGAFAGKTGTTQDNADGWFIGFTPRLTAGCRVGADDQAVHFRTMTYGQGAFSALPVVGRFFSQTYADNRFKNWKEESFAPPDSMILADMNSIPEHKEEIEEDFGFFDIFRKKDENMRGDKGRRRSEVNRGDSDREREPAWEIIRRIFKKKENREEDLPERD